MAAMFPDVPVVRYEGPKSKNPFSFHYYDPDQIILGKSMREHLPFAMAWWHNLCACGTDMFGQDTMNKAFDAVPGTMDHALKKVDAGLSSWISWALTIFVSTMRTLLPLAAPWRNSTATWTKSLITYRRKWSRPERNCYGELPTCSAIRGL